MLFDAPQWLWGSFFALIVPIIHLLGRRSVKPIPIPSLMWLQQYRTQDRRRNRIKEWLLVVLRMLVIALFFISLSGPKIVGTTTALLVDNSPALWSQSKFWLPQALKEVPEGKYVLHVRGGISLGTFHTREIVEALKDWPSSSAPLEDYDEAIIVSAGFAVLPENAKSFYLPKRTSFVNGRITMIEENAREQSFAISNGLHSGSWEVRDSSALLLTENDSIVRIPWQSINSNSLDLTFTGDSVLEDNQQRIYRPARLPIIALNMPSAKKLDKLPVDREFTYTNAVDLQQLPPKAILLLNGFSYLPEKLLNESYVLLRFATKPTEAIASEVLPVLEVPFFTDYFIGASDRNRWPNPKMTSNEDLTELQPWLKTANGTVLAGWHERSNGQTIYEQSFPINEVGHPYYKALLQWATNRSLGTNSIRLIHYGSDQYELNLSNLEASKIHYFNWSRTLANTGKSVQFWTESKIALALALFCALIALIFAKI